MGNLFSLASNIAYINKTLIESSGPCKISENKLFYYYRPQRSCGKVMFFAPVRDSVYRGGSSPGKHFCLTNLSLFQKRKKHKCSTLDRFFYDIGGGIF